MALQPPVGRAIRTSVASIGAALDHAVDAVTMTHSPVQSISGASGVPSRQRVRPTMDIPGTSMSSMTHNEHHPLRTLSSDMESLGSSREHTMEWKLPSEEQVYEKLPWTRGALFNTVVSTAIFLNTVWLGIGVVGDRDRFASPRGLRESITGSLDGRELLLCVLFLCGATDSNLFSNLVALHHGQLE